MTGVFSNKYQNKLILLGKLYVDGQITQEQYKQSVKKIINKYKLKALTNVNLRLLQLFL